MMAADAQVEYNFLSGNCGLKVSNICLGTMIYGKTTSLVANSLVNEEDSHKLFDRYAALGGNFIDTSNVYCGGESEEVIGSWLKKQNREEFIIGTKVRCPPKGLTEQPRHANDVGLSRRHIIQSIDDSLKRLQTDYIDLYQTHAWDSGVPIEETMSTLNDLVRVGKVRYVGVCNITGWQLQNIICIGKYMGFSPCVSVQQEYNLLDRLSEYEPFEVCKNQGLGVLPWSPLKGGLLTGKFKRGMTSAPQGSRVEWISGQSTTGWELAPHFKDFENNESYWRIRDLLDAMATKHKKSVAQVSLRWLLQKEPVTSVIIGARTMANLEDNMGAAKGWSLSDEEMRQLDDASANTSKYPYNSVYAYNADRLRKGCPHGRQY